MHQPVVLAPPVPLREWRPDLPKGDLRSISLHWTAYGYDEVFPAYHFCITRPDDVVVHHTHDLRENMRDVRLDPALPYAAHTSGRNSWAAGISIAAMRDATPADFGPCPLTRAQLDGACSVAAVLVRFYGIGVAAVKTHAEAALEDGYFGAGPGHRRWDIARFEPAPAPLEPAEATRAGDWFRDRIAALIAHAR
jgi:hypothetical protein